MRALIERRKYSFIPPALVVWLNTTSQTEIYAPEKDV
jgi:hypothetical protein